MGYIVSSLHLLKERILSISISSTYVSFSFSPPPKFFPKLFFPKHVLFFLFLSREKDVFKTYVDHRGSCFPNSLFPLILCCVCFLFTLWLSCLCQYMTKRGRNRRNVGILFVLFRRSWDCFWNGEKIKHFDVSNLGGELEFISFIDSYCLYVFLFTYTMCSFECFKKDKYILIKTFYLSLQLLG